MITDSEVPAAVRVRMVRFYGFEVTWRGALVGAWWAFMAGFVAGWFAAFLRNVCIAVWLTKLRIKAHLQETRGFLDRI